MIIEYYRPQTLQEALALLGRPEPPTKPLGGGSVLNQPSREPLAVVDLQALGLDGYQTKGNILELGATLTLQGLLESLELNPGSIKPLVPGLPRAIRHEATHNLRQMATVAGTIVAAGGSSPFTTAILALDAVLTIASAGDVASSVAETTLSIGDLLPLRRGRLEGRLITRLTLPTNAHLVYESIARSPADLPIVCAAMAIWPSGRTRLALGGYGKTPLLAFDGPEATGVETAAKSAYSEAGDEWATAAYRQEMAGVLARRCLETLQKEK